MFLQNLKSVFFTPLAIFAFFMGLSINIHVDGGSLVSFSKLYAQDMMDESTPAPSEISSGKIFKRSKDFVKSKTEKVKPATKTKPAKTPSNSAVKSNDLMDAMKETISPSLPAAVVPAVVAPEVVPSATPAPQVASPTLPPVTAPPVPVQETPKRVEEQKAAPVENPIITRKEDLLKKETPKADVPKTEPEKLEMKPEPSSGAPLLTDINEAPSLLGTTTPVVEEKAKTEEKPAETAPTNRQEKAAPTPEKMAPVLPDVPEGFSKPRPLFSSPAQTKKRTGIRRYETLYDTMPAVPLATKNETEKSSAPATANEVPLPPLEERNVEASIIKPSIVEPQKETKNSIWKAAPAAETGGGKVLFSQSADGQSAPPVVEEEVTKPAFGAMPNAEESEDPAPVSKSSAPASASRLTSTSVYNPAAGPMIHASCGAANGIGTDMKPNNYLCTQGTPSSVSGQGPWSWNCLGSNGGTNASCNAPIQVNGECGMANGSLSASAPIGQLCKSGKATGVTGGGPWYWSCLGDNGGVVAQCTAYTLVSGVCGPASNLAAASTPQVGLCSSGTETSVVGDGPWTWNCVGSGEGTTANCIAPKRNDGMCGSANGIGFATAPVSGLCASGTASSLQGNGPWNWTCLGDNGGMNSACSAQTLTNAACGPAHGFGTNTKPADALCNEGTPTIISGNGPWTWTCRGDNGGAPVDCMAPMKVDGVCGPSHQNGSAEKPLTGLCTSGTAGAVAGSGPWQWACQGAAGGVTANCIAQPLVHAACGPSHGVSVSSPPSAGLCNDGTATTVIGSGPFLWSCQGVQGGSTVNCMAPLQVNGSCGSADALPVQTAPINGLCATGAASAITGNGPWIWTCQGAGGGISTTCQAPVQQAEAKPTPPPVPAQVPKETAAAGNECSPSVKRWTITCQQGGYPSNYTGVIVGETQVLCPTGVERGVWLSNSCAPATSSAPVSPSPGRLEVPPPPSLPQVMERLPDIKPLPAKDLSPPAKKLSTPRFRGELAAAEAAQPAPSGGTIKFAPVSEGLDSAAIQTLDELVSNLSGNDKAIVTLNAYAATPADGSQQEARRLALARALSARSYLMRKGLSSSRIDVRAVGPATDGLGDDRVDINVK